MADKTVRNLRPLPWPSHLHSAKLSFVVDRFVDDVTKVNKRHVEMGVGIWNRAKIFVE